MLFEQTTNVPATQQQQGAPQRTTGSVIVDRDDVNTHPYENVDERKPTGTVRDGVKNLVKSGLDNLKSVLPTKRSEQKTDEHAAGDQRRSSDDSGERTPNRSESPSLLDKFKDKFKKSSVPSKADDQEQQAEAAPYDRLWQASSQQEGKAREAHQKEKLNNSEMLVVVDAACLLFLCQHASA